jgi:hypothetical protein
MIKFTTKLAFAASLITLTDCPYEVQASDGVIQAEETGSASLQRPVLIDTAASIPQRTSYEIKEWHGSFQDGITRDVIKVIFVEAFKQDADPRVLERVCKAWYNALRYQIPSVGAPKADLAGFLFTTKLNDIFMEDCMKLYMDGIVSRGVLYYKKGDAEKERTIHFSDFQNGIANLADCEEQARSQVYTDNLEHLTLVGGANENKLVTFLGAFHRARHLLPADAKGSVLDVVAIWNWGNEALRNDQGVILFDYLIISPSLLRVGNMLENWQKSVVGRYVEWAREFKDGVSFFHVCF